MSLSIPVKTFLVLILVTYFGSFGLAQQPTNSTEQAKQNTEAFAENDSLPFMRTEKTSESAEPGTGSLVVKTLGSMILIIGLIFLGAWSLKKLGFGVNKPNAVVNAPEVAVLSTVSLGTNRTLSVIKFGERMLLIGSTAQSFTLLADEASEKTVSIKPSRSVAELLAEEEENSFAVEFSHAQSRLNLLENEGELM